MRTIKNLEVPQNNEAKFPFSTIQNETDTQDGTPVVEEIYGDVLTNIYKLLQSVGITPTETQDSDTSQYQILQALKKLPNSLNDIEQTLHLDSTTWSVPFNLEFLPNKYFFIARASDDYVAGITYNFVGTDNNAIAFTSDGFKTSDQLLVIIDTSGVRAYSLSFLSNAPKEVFASLGTPISFNDTNKMWYEDEGKLISDVPSINDLQSVIRLNLSEGTVLVHNMFVMNGYVLCFCSIPSANNYFFRKFAVNDLTVSSAVSISGISFSNTNDYSPYVYAESGFVYVTNAMNTTVNNYSITKLNFISGNLVFNSTFNLDNTFVKTSNVVVKFNKIYTMIFGNLKSFSFLGDVRNEEIYPSVNGQIFSFNGNVYFNSGEVCKLWF